MNLSQTQHSIISFVLFSFFVLIMIMLELANPYTTNTEVIASAGIIWIIVSIAKIYTESRKNQVTIKISGN